MAEARPTLLLVDDERDVLDILIRTFERRFEVIGASSGREALEVLRRQPVDVLVTDQKMPKMTGIELIAQVRQEGFDVAPILLTGYTDPGDLIAAINQGQVFRYITKPWDVNDLTMTVANALQVTRLRREKEHLLSQLKKRVDALSVLYEVSREGAAQALTDEVIIDRLLLALERVLPYECGAALLLLGDGKSAQLRIRCAKNIAQQALWTVKEAVLSAHRIKTGQFLLEDQVMVRVNGGTSQEDPVPSEFRSRLNVSLVSSGQTVGTLCLFANGENAYSSEDGELLDVLANQTTDAIWALRANEDEARRRMERMVESMADGVLLTDEKNQIVVLNPSARQLLRLGDDPGEWTARHLQEALGFYPFELVRGWEYGGPKVLREDLKIFDRTLQSTVTPVTDGRGSLKGVCVILRDVTEQRQLEERKEEFVSVVSHELRTPLTSISGALDLVLNVMAGDITEKQRRYLAMAKDSTDKLNGIVDDLLDLSKFAKGRLRMNFELVHLDELVRRAAEKYGPAFLEKKLRLNSDVPQMPLRALADPNRITQVLNNLLTNAVKFTPEGGEVHISLSDSPGLPGHVSFACWNSGEGIADADLERIFDRFEQARTERSRTIRGTGLGLAISRNIIEAHGGQIWAEPCVQGARFVLVLPMEPPHELLSPEDREASPKAIRPKPLATLLIVQNEQPLAYMLKALLLSRGYRVVLASSPDEAVALARRHHPDLVLVNSQLPGKVDGLALGEIVRHDPETRNTTVLITSEVDERQKAFRMGFAGFLQKPLQPDKLFSAVDSLARGLSRRKRGRILVVDDDAKVASICQEMLSNLGFEVLIAGTLQEARKVLREKRPELLVLDVVLPDGSGFDFLEELKAERASIHLSVIFVSARNETSAKVRALKSGGDDYLTKPFDALELGARVESVLRRKEQELGSSPTTQLPGSGAIEREVQRRLAEKKRFAFCYLDLDNLKAYNDYYGFAKADGVVRQTGDLLREIIAQEGMPGDFLGHVAGDDFVFILDARSVDMVCQRATEAFDRIIPLYYDRQDRERGYIEAEDRFAVRRKFPIMSVSVVAVMCNGSSHDHAELARIAADLKKRAKAIQGSIYLRSDRDLILQKSV